MNKKIIGAIIILIAIAIFAFFLFENKPDKEKNANELTNEITENENQNNESGANTSTGKVLVVYFSATNNTKNVAEKIAKNLNGDTFEIVPVDEYTSEDLNYSNPDSRVSKEHNDESLRNVNLKNTKVENWENYNTIIIGYPIWWGIAAWPVNTFVSSNNFEGKTVIPFCTSASSGLGQSGKLLESIAKGGNWLDGHRFTSIPSDSDIKAFTDSIK